MIDPDDDLKLTWTNHGIKNFLLSTIHAKNTIKRKCLRYFFCHWTIVYFYLTSFTIALNYSGMIVRSFFCVGGSDKF